MLSCIKPTTECRNTASKVPQNPVKVCSSREVSHDSAPEETLFSLRESGIGRPGSNILIIKLQFDFTNTRRHITRRCHRQFMLTFVERNKPRAHLGFHATSSNLDGRNRDPTRTWNDENIINSSDATEDVVAMISSA